MVTKVYQFESYSPNFPRRVCPRTPYILNSKANKLLFYSVLSVRTYSTKLYVFHAYFRSVLLLNIYLIITGVLTFSKNDMVVVL